MLLLPPSCGRQAFVRVYMTTAPHTRYCSYRLATPPLAVVRRLLQRGLAALARPLSPESVRPIFEELVESFGPLLAPESGHLHSAERR